MCHLKQFLRDQRGLENVEYGVIAGVVLVGAATVIMLLGLWVQARLDSFKSEVQGAGGAKVTMVDRDSR